MNCCVKCNKPFIYGQQIKTFEGKKYCLDCWNIGKPVDIDEVLKKAFSDIPAAYPQVFDERHDVSNKMLTNLKKVAYYQDDYGMEKYKEALHHTYNYNWLQMTMEELADGLKYIQNEIDRKKQVLQMLEYAINTKSWSVVKRAYEELSTSGTGK